MDSLDIEKAVIVGMSQGGYAGLRMALTKPDRVAALVLMSTQADVDDEAFRAQCVEMRDTWQKDGPVEPIMQFLANALLGPKDDEGMAKHWDTWLPKWGAVSGLAMYHAANHLKDRDDIVDSVHQITHPTLITHGDADIAVPLTHAHKLSKLISNSLDVVVVPGAAHAANYTHPLLINEALMAFLKRSIR